MFLHVCTYVIYDLLSLISHLGLSYMLKDIQKDYNLHNLFDAMCTCVCQLVSMAQVDVFLDVGPNGPWQNEKATMTHDTWILSLKVLISSSLLKKTVHLV
jgi:hypothetical protein